MIKTTTYKKVYIALSIAVACLLLTSCRYVLHEEKRIEIISSIAAIVMDNYKYEDMEKPLTVDIREIENLSDSNSEIIKAIEKYDEIGQYKIYYINDMVIVETAVIFQGVQGYVVSNEELGNVLHISGLGFDGNRLDIVRRIEGSNIYVFSAGL